MAPLQDGVYEIRFVPNLILPPIIGGLYATGELINAPVRAEALGPGAKGNQTWEVRSVGNNLYTITYPETIPPGGGHGPVVPGFGVRTVSSGKDPVILQTGLAEFSIEATSHATNQYFIANIILPNPGIVGSTRAITEDAGILYVEYFPIFENSPPLPRWEFIAVKK